MRDDRYFSSASMNTYIHWVLKEKLGLNDKEVRKNLNIVLALAKVEFVWRHPMDENRAIDGLELRDDFEYETGDYKVRFPRLPRRRQKFCPRDHRSRCRRRRREGILEGCRRY